MKTVIILFNVILYTSNLLAQDFKRIDSLQVKLSKCKSDTNRAKLLYQIGNEWEFYNLSKSQGYFEEMLLLSKKISYNKGIATAYDGLGRISIVRGAFKQALLYFNCELDLQTQLADSVGIAAVYDNSSIALMSLENIDSAIFLRFLAINIYKGRNDFKKIASGYQWIGNFFTSKSDYTQALKFYLKSLEVSKKINDSEATAYCSFGCANIYIHRKEYSKALKLMRASLDFFEKADRKQEVATIYYSMSNIYYQQDMVQEALKHAFNSLEIRISIPDSAGLANSYNSIGTIYSDIRNFSLADKYYRMSLDIAKKLELKETVALIFINLGTNFAKQNKFKESIPFFLKGLEINQEMLHTEAASTCCQQLSIAYEKLMDNANALKYFKMYKIMNDSIQMDIQSKTINELEVKYETEQKNHQIIVLNKDNEIKQVEISKVNYRFKLLIIGALLIILLGGGGLLYWQKVKADRYNKLVLITQQKALVAQMNTHFISDVLQAINMNMKRGHNIKASDYLINFSRLIRTVLEDSFKQNVFLSHEMSVVEKYFNLARLRFPEGHINFVSYISPNLNFNTTQIPPLVLQVLVSNCIKHGFTNEVGGQVMLKIEKTGTLLSCIVEDNGIGRKTSQQNRIEEDISYGSNIAEKLIRLWGHLEKRTTYKIIDLQDETGKAVGTRTEIVIPLILNDHAN